MWTFEITDDAEGEPGFYSIWLDNGQGSGAEIAGRIGSRIAAEKMCDALNAMSQDEINTLFGE